MRKRRLLKNFIGILLIVAFILPMLEPISVSAKRREYSIGHSADLEHPYRWKDYSDENVEAEILAEQQEAGSKNDFNVNYYTIREMVLNNEYDSEILSKKYQMMDEYLRFYAQFDDDKPFFDLESKQIVIKVGIVDKIWQLDNGSVVFTLVDNPTKRFLIMPGYDYFHFRYVTEPGDKVHLLTTTDRVVYEFDNYNLTRGQKVNYSGYMNYKHPEDMIIDGFFPSKLYQERLEAENIPLESWLQLMLEYVDVEGEQYDGYAYYMNYNINPDRIQSVEEYRRRQKEASSQAEEMRNDEERYANRVARSNANGFDYDSIEELLSFTYGEIREVKVNHKGETVFTLWENPTKWFYMSKYYDPLHLADITKPGDEVYVIHTADRIVYGFDNSSLFGEFFEINNPDFLEQVTYVESEFAEFWSRVNELPEEKKQRYEVLRKMKD